MADDLKYLRALLTSDSAVISELYKDTLPKVKKFVVQNKGSVEDGEDVFQKALVQIAVRYKKNPFSIKSSFKAFLFTACKNLWRRELNKSSHWVTKDIEEEQFYMKNEDAHVLLEQERLELFQAALGLSSDNCKSILEMFFNDVSYADMVKDLAYSSETVARQRVFKCKKKLIELIKDSPRFNALREL
ncbi:RNA polymerase sigma factor [Nonlabens ulvanivorans]|uniref:RNA polymerase sigma factor n=1 Tax=Nonlabens ulvanivorans TaxID=906888 RepID=UPI002943B5D0|nr:sigma-70 family RNA polymerase sigma factor [Nonlabens ulvanivorans]WOI21579.1 sigma-70 family RNA polymerase sigma factor [Nonlabens ulvanivorans]